MPPRVRAEPDLEKRGSATKSHGPRVFLLAVVAGLLLLAGAGYLLLGADPEQTGSGETVHLNIPADATDLLEQGKDVPGIPERITGTVGDTLVIRNRDRSTQVVAGYPISPGQTLKIPLNRAGNYTTTCTAHADDSIRMLISE